MRNNVKSSRWNVALPENTAKAIDQIYALAGYASRSEFLSQAAKSMVENIKQGQAAEQERGQGLLKMTGALKGKVSLSPGVPPIYGRAGGPESGGLPDAGSRLEFLDDGVAASRRGR